MKAYVIGLEEPIQKIEYLQTFGLDPIWLEGVNGQKLGNDNVNEDDEELMIRYVKPYSEYVMPKSAIGCALSHIKAWREFLSTDDEYAIIFEDDVVLEDGFVEKTENALRAVPDDYDILYLGCFGCDPTNLSNVYKLSMMMYGKNKRAGVINQSISIPEVSYATHAYIVSRKGAERLLSLFSENVDDHVDMMLNSFAVKNLIVSYVTTPRLAYQTSTDTSNSENIKTNHPSLVTDMLRKHEIDKLARADYIATVAIKQVGSYTINIMSIFFLLIGILLALCKIPIVTLTVLYILVSIPDVPSISTNKNMLQTILINYVIFIAPSVILYLHKNNMNNKNKK